MANINRKRIEELRRVVEQWSDMGLPDDVLGREAADESFLTLSEFRALLDAYEQGGRSVTGILTAEDTQGKGV